MPPLNCKPFFKGFYYLLMNFTNDVLTFKDCILCTRHFIRTFEELSHLNIKMLSLVYKAHVLSMT